MHRDARRATVLTILGLGLALAFAPEHSAAGPVSKLYLTAGVEIDTVQGATATQTPTTSSGQYPIAIGATIRTTANTTNLSGAEYSLGLVPTGADYPNPGILEIYDGTTDGAHNYAITYPNGLLYQFDLDWSNPTLLFSTASTGNGYEGITYDATNNSLWLSALRAGTVADYTLSGTLLSSFDTGHIQNASLALDPADNSLWIYNKTTDHDAAGPLFEQYNKTGALLSTARFAALIGDAQGILGGEFAPITTGAPEPSTLAMSGIAIMVSALIRFKRRRSLNIVE
jgi:hypothetical protein